MSDLELPAREAAGKYGLDPRLICALCEVESAWIPWAVRHEAGYKWTIYFTREPNKDHGNNPQTFPDAAGNEWHPRTGSLLTLLGGLATSYARVHTELLNQQTSWGLLQIMGAVARERGFRGWLTELCDPSINLEWGCRHLRWMMDHNNAYGLPDFGIKPEDLAAAWNAGTRIVIDGKYKNQPYVDRVLRAMEGYQ